MKARVKWVGEAKFLTLSESGHGVLVDGPADAGGENMGIRPMEMVLMGMGACTSFDVVSILRKSRQPVVDCVAEIEATRADDVPSVFTDIHVHFVVTGAGVREAQVKRAVELSADKYCSASIMLWNGGVRITHDYEIREE